MTSATPEGSSGCYRPVVSSHAALFTRSTSTQTYALTGQLGCTRRPQLQGSLLGRQIAEGSQVNDQACLRPKANARDALLLTHDLAR